MSPRTEERLVKVVLWAVAAVVITILLSIVVHVMVRGIPSVNLTFLTEMPRRMGKEGGISTVLAGTLYVVTLSLFFATPIGVAAAVYLAEYARESRLVSAIRFSIESLAGIPSIIFGLFGFVFFVLYLRMGWSIISGALTLALMILPTIVRTTEESLKAVPSSYKEGSLALGATRLQTIFKMAIPSALPGILTGILLGTGRAVGETAAVLLTAGSSALSLPRTIKDPARTLAVHLFILSHEGISMEKAYATATVLIVSILALNSLTTSLLTRFRQRLMQ